MCAAPEGQSTLLYIDLHLVLEVTSRQTFDGLFTTGGQTHQPQRRAATVDHHIPSKERTLGLGLAWVLREPSNRVSQANWGCYGKEQSTLKSSRLRFYKTASASPSTHHVPPLRKTLRSTHCFPWCLRSVRAPDRNE